MVDLGLVTVLPKLVTLHIVNDARPKNGVRRMGCAAKVLVHRRVWIDAAVKV